MKRGHRALTERSEVGGHRAKRGNFIFILLSFIIKKIPPESQGEPIILAILYFIVVMYIYGLKYINTDGLPILQRIRNVY